MDEMLTTLRWTGSPRARSCFAYPLMTGWAARRSRNGEVDVEHGLPLLVGHLLDDGVPGVAGVVDDDVQPAEGRDGRVDKAGGEVGVGHAADEGNRGAAGSLDGLRRLRCRLGVEVVDDHVRALRGQLDRHGTTDAASGPGDEGDLPVEPRHRPTSAARSRMWLATRAAPLAPTRIV
jgi:hypothetical protein